MKIAWFCLIIVGSGNQPPTWSPLYFPPTTRRPTNFPLKVPTSTPLFITTTPSLPLFTTNSPSLTTLNLTATATTAIASKVQTVETPIGVFLSIHWFYELMAALGLIVVVLSLCFINCVYIHVKRAENREVDLG